MMTATDQTAATNRYSDMSKRVRRRRMTESSQIFDRVENRRMRKQVIVQGVQIASRVTVIEPDEFSRLNIDDAYQRVRITNKTNDLINVLINGGHLVDRRRPAAVLGAPGDA
jgi:hypothetical protein